MNTMFCLVSRQAMANVLPVLMYKPQNVVLFTTPEEKSCADNLEKLFRSKDISVKRIDGLNAYDYIGFKEGVKKELEFQQGELLLNVTGGTKLMALAAYEAFAEKDKKIIYCDTENKHIISIFPDYKIEELIAEISIEDYLFSYGYSILETKDTSIIQMYFPLFEFILQKNLIKEFISLLDKVRQINITDKPRKTIQSNNKNFSFSKNYDIYKISFNNSSITLNSSQFKLGDWLEYFVYYLLTEKYNLEPLCGVKIISNKGIKNELDIIVLKNYQLHIISCKSGKIDNDDLFQLETLRNITSGTFGKGIFISAERGTKEFLVRAKELNIETVVTDSEEIFNYKAVKLI